MAENNTLLIIGNGFDLYCGLKTSYRDFFEWLREHDEDFRRAYEELKIGRASCRERVFVS
ncbi:MAG: bacteriophage abortive infection AbiH family protein, partial [Oscillospiraceae bacterium]|nr:bacteriophage abortive infection AbiH family protein [Oscillospiraceae bacterium]